MGDRVRARVRAGDGPCEVVVEAGYLLGPYGDEIQIDSDVVIDVCSEDLDGNVSSPCGPVDPWCSDVRVDRPADRPVYLAVAYAECLPGPSARSPTAVAATTRPASTAGSATPTGSWCSTTCRRRTHRARARRP